MKLPTTFRLTISAVLLGAMQMHAATVTIYNTGIANGNGLDSHYTLTSMPSGAGYGTDPVVISNASSIFPATSIPNSTTGYTSWLANQTGENAAAWIGPAAQVNTFGNCVPTGGTTCGVAVHTSILAGVYDYSTTFDLALFSPDSTVLTGNWTTDGRGTNIYLNGHALNLKTKTPTTGATAGSYTEFTAFTISNATCAGCFNTGVNTLTFEVNNGADESGLMVQIAGNSSTINSNASATPEPATWFSLATGMGLLGLLRRRR